MKRVKNKGILFWITGVSGAGKSTISKKIFNSICKNYGPTLLINGDDIRKIFGLKGYKFEDRKKIGKCYSKLFKKITNQNINVIFAGIVLIDQVRDWNRKNFENYFEIYLKTDLKKIISKKYKKIYAKTKDLVGLDVKVEYPKKPDLIILNDFNKSINNISKDLFTKIKKLIN